MRASWIFVFLGLLAMIALLVVSNASLSHSVEQLELRFTAVVDSRTEDQVEQLREERVLLGVERTRLAGQVGAMRKLVEQITATSSAGLQAAEASEVDDILPDRAEFADDSEGPNLLDIPLLTEAQKEELRTRHRSIGSPKPPASVLLSGNVEFVLEDEQWNPQGRQLASSERKSLDGLLQRYKYFARIAPVKAVRNIVKPAMADMADAGAFMEFEPGTPTTRPPKLESDGRPVVSVTGPSEREDTRRRYFFYPEEHPDLYHWRQVENERGLEAYVQIHEFINRKQTARDE